MACIAKRRSRYVIDFYDTYGKRRWKTLPKGTAKKKAHEALRDIEDQLRRGIYIPDKKIPIFLDVAKDWLELKNQNVRHSTWKMYKSHLKHHFQDVDNIKINRITTAKVEKFICDKQKSGMNLTTLRKIIITFKQVMNYAVRHKYINHNPVRDSERPKGQGDEEKNKIEILTPSQINALLEVEKNQKYQTLFMLAVFSGARQGELFGLKWSDIDWFNNQISIERTYNNGEWYKPKSRTSKRKIDLGPTVMMTLKKWKLACPRCELDLVFPNYSGIPLDHGYMLRHHFRPALKKARIPKIKFHNLRHTYASLLIEQGESIKYIQSQMGHSSPTVTLDVYAHLMKPTNQEAACKLENAIFETNGSKMVAKTEKGATVQAVIP